MKTGEIKCLYDEIVSIDQLSPNPKNPNKHGERQLKTFAKILDKQGWRRPVRVSKLSGFMTVGHGSVMAARLNGWTHVPVNYQDYESPEMEYADIVADNALAKQAELDFGLINIEVPDLGPDFDMDLLGITGFEIDPADKYVDRSKDDEIPAIPVNPKTKLGDIFVLGRHRLMCGDALDFENLRQLINGRTIDMVYTDPPYGLKVVKRTGLLHGNGLDGVCASNRYRPVIGDHSNKTAIRAVEICTQMEIKRMIFWGANFYSSALPNHSGWVVWDKENGEGFFADGELAWSNTDKQLRIFRHKWRGMIKASEHGEKRIHPTQKPVALAEWCFENYGQESTIILDMFGGSGSTLIACERNNRYGLIMELDPGYCDLMLDRWSGVTGEDPIRQDGALWSKIKQHDA